MKRIENSPIKEAMRQHNENNARSRENQIRNKMNSDIAQIVGKNSSRQSQIRNERNSEIAQIVYKNKFSGLICFYLVFFGGCLGGGIGEFNDAVGVYWLYGMAGGSAVYILLNLWVKNYNKQADEKKRKLEEKAEHEIRKGNAEADVEKRRLEEEAERGIRDAYNEADRKTVQEINAYDNEVKQYCQKILQKADTVSPMVQHMTNMFQRIVSHADMGPNRRFVEAYFIYEVNFSEIIYIYQSEYTNPMDNFNFDQQRFRNLNSNTECEGLAQALARLTIKKMMSLYPPNSLNITVSHIDSRVTLHYKAANKNFIAARDIF